jgi:hypothetical protein
MRGIPANAFSSSQQLRKCQTLITNQKARRPGLVEFTPFPWIETWQPCCNCIGVSAKTLKNGEAIGSGLSIERADLEWRKTKDV